MPRIKIIILLIIAVIVLVLVSLWVVDYYFKPEFLVSPEKQKQEEIQKIQKLVQQAIETGEKEPLITISKDGFSQTEIKIKPNSFISFYNSTDKPVEFDAYKIDPGVTASIKFKENTEIKLNNRVLKIYVN